MSVFNLARVSARIILSGQMRRFHIRTYGGSPKDICRSIVEACYDSKKKYFRTSVDTYPELWTRDFGRCVPALINAGYRDEVVNTYRFAFDAFQKSGRYELTILPDGQLYNFPFGTYSPDGYAFFLYGLCALDDESIIDDNSVFLAQESQRFFRLTVNPSDGTVKTNVHFSEAQDYLRRNSSCYTTCCCFIVQQALAKLGIANPLTNFDYPLILKERYYSDAHGYFYDDMFKRHFVSGDANILPFWSGAVSRQPFGCVDDILIPVLDNIEKSQLNMPYPTRYRNGTEKLPSLRLDRINPWQTSSVWTCLGIHYLEMLYLYAPHHFTGELNRFVELIDRLRCFPEVVSHKTKTLYRYPLYVSETSMLWAANLLNLLQDNPRVVHEHF
ncbi:MAG: hypothetical protein JXX14_08590 [Deltaproteobacteria bacterium]|nr:hypothetical protein [Deltaproteobacteria bacterium]